MSVDVIEINAAKNPDGTNVHIFREETETRVLGFRVVVDNGEKTLYVSHLHTNIHAGMLFSKKLQNGALIRQ